LICPCDQTFNFLSQLLKVSSTYLRTMIVDKFIVRNVTAEQRLVFDTRELDVGMYHVLIPVIFFALRIFLVVFAMRCQLHLLPPRHLISFASDVTSGKSSLNSGISASLSKIVFRAPVGSFPIVKAPFHFD
jgi:hypothetical protein